MTGKVTFAYLHPGEVSAVFMDSVIDMLFFESQTHPERFAHPYGKMGKRAGSAGIVDGRNQVTRVFLDESESDWLLMIDADMGFAHDTCSRLIESAHAQDRPIMGGLCFAYAQDGKRSLGGSAWRPVPTLYDWVDDGDEYGFLPRVNYLDSGERIQAVAGTGAACVLIHRNAAEAIRDRYGDNEWWEPIRHPRGRKFSEDLSFCVRAASCDLPLYVDTSVKTTHHKGAIYYDEQAFTEYRLGA